MVRRLAAAAVFDGRADLSLDQLVSTFGVDPTQASALKECLSLFTQEFDIPIGKLRPADPLEYFWTRQPTRNPLTAFIREAAIQDGISELSYRMALRREVIGTPISRFPESVGEYVGAWLGADMPLE